MKKRVLALFNEQRQYDYTHQKDLVATKIPPSAPKQARDDAMNQPWRGTENVKDASLRMLVDVHKPLKISNKQRLSNARENSIDYRHNEAAGPTHKERLNKPRSSSGVSGMGTIESIAGQQIEDAIARGQFRDLPRGKPLEMEKMANPYLDTTEYLLNNMIKRQGAAPPWVTKQSAVSSRTEAFRAELVSKLGQHLMHRRGNYATRQAAVQAWIEHNKEYNEIMVNSINSDIRGYNIQAPYAARRGYVSLDRMLAAVDAAVGTPKAVSQVTETQLDPAVSSRTTQKTWWKLW